MRVLGSSKCPFRNKYFRNMELQLQLASSIVTLTWVPFQHFFLPRLDTLRVCLPVMYVVSSSLGNFRFSSFLFLSQYLSAFTLLPCSAIYKIPLPNNQMSCLGAKIMSLINISIYETSPQMISFEGTSSSRTFKSLFRSKGTGIPLSKLGITGILRQFNICNFASLYLYRPYFFGALEQVFCPSGHSCHCRELCLHSGNLFSGRSF